MAASVCFNFNFPFLRKLYDQAWTNLTNTNQSPHEIELTLIIEKNQLFSDSMLPDDNRNRIETEKMISLSLTQRGDLTPTEMAT